MTTETKSKKPREYIVTSKSGMTPYATVRTIRAARKESRGARMLGLDGTIVPVH